MRGDALFRIASLMKPMTAALVLSLADEGLVDLDEPVDRLLPELAYRRVLRRTDGPLQDTVPAARPICVRELFTFTWGLGMQGAMFLTPTPWPIVAAALDWRLSTFGPPQPSTTPDPDTWMARLGELPLLAQPGERWLYQTGSQVLGVLVARLVVAPLEQVLRERVLAPLGMDETGFHAADAARLTTAYERVGGQRPTPNDSGRGLPSSRSAARGSSRAHGTWWRSAACSSEAAMGSSHRRQLLR